MTKCIDLSDDAYRALQGMKRPDESFSDLVRRLVARRRTRRPIAESAGTWPMTQDESDRLVEDLYRQRDRSA